MIEKLIHQIWLDKHEYENEGPVNANPIYLKYIKTWKEMNPQCEYIFWNKKKIMDYIIHNQLVPQKWKNFFLYTIKRHIEKCDVSRYLILWIVGGLYVDLDFVCVKSVEPLFVQQKQLGLVREPVQVSRGGIANAFMMSRKRDPMWPLLIEHIIDNYSPDKPVTWTTGTHMLGKFVRSLHLPKSCFIDCTLIMPYLPGGFKTIESMVKNPNPYTFTKWNEGTGWQTNFSHLNLGNQRVIFAFIVLSIIVFLASTIL